MLKFGYIVGGFIGSKKVLNRLLTNKATMNKIIDYARNPSEARAKAFKNFMTKQSGLNVRELTDVLKKESLGDEEIKEE